MLLPILLTGWAIGTQNKSKKSSHSSHQKKPDTSVKDFMKTLDSRVKSKIKTGKEYEKLRSGLW